ncbi:MAG: DUF1189 family protein [Patescibacteria group bacterium]
MQFNKKLFQWIKTFRISIVGSLTDLNYYLEILNTPTRFSIKVVAMFYLLLGIVLTGIFIVKDLPKINATFNSIRTELTTTYPDNLVFDWRDQRLSSNSDQPVVVPFPAITQPLDTAPQHLAVIDTHTDQDPENVKALIYITETKMFINSMQGNWAEANLSDVIETESGHLDKQEVLKQAAESEETQRQILQILPWLTLLTFSLGLFIIRMLTVLFNALIVQLLFQILNKPLAYKKVLQLCLHALIPTEIIYQISARLFPHLNFPMFGLAFWLIISLLIWHLRHLQVVRFSLENDQHGKKK